MNYRILLFVITLSCFFKSANCQEEKYIGLFIYNFTKYFDWPENTKTGDFIIEVIGHKTVYDELGRITAGKKIGSQNIVIKNFNSVENIGVANIVFLGHWQSKYLPNVLSQITDKPTLVITEMDGMLEKGANINFVIREGTIKFEMNATSVNQRSLKTDPRIRQLAYKVVE